MKVILLQNVKNVGQVNQVVDVAAGFARNFLLRQGLAKIADQAAVADLQRHQAAHKAKIKAEAERARGLAGKVLKLTLEMTAPGTATGTLYAALKESAILAKLRKSVSNLLPAARLVDYRPIKTAGEYEVKLELTEGIQTKIQVKLKTDADQ